MLSDESSSDSETGRFKSTQSHKSEQKSSSHARDRPAERSRYSGSERYRSRIRPSEIERSRPENEQIRGRQREERDHYERYTRDHHRPQRHSPVRKYSRDRSADRTRRSHDLQRNRQTSKRNDYKHYHRSSSRDRRRSRSRRSTDRKRTERLSDLNKESKSDLLLDSNKDQSATKYDRNRVKDSSSSPDYKSKVLVVKNPTPEKVPTQTESPIDVDLQPGSDDEVQPGSYYSMIPAVVKDKEKSIEKDISKETISDESSEIDSSDDERLRAKLLNLEKELSKTRKKKHKKKHKKKSSKSKNEKDRDKSTSVEVTSTTDIQEQKNSNDLSSEPEVVEVTSTQRVQKESSEEGEITSEDDSQLSADNDPNDLRHKLKRSTKVDVSGSPDLRDRLKSKSDVCGPALPPHLQKRPGNISSEVEGPALPPHLKSKDKHIGPSIPSEMRKVLANRQVIKYESSDDEGLGPLPAGAEDKWTDAHQRLEERALEMKIKKLDGHTLQSKDVKSREKWMLELPEAKAKILGLEGRSFRAREGPDMSDRSSWTDTPEEKARKKSGLPSVPEDPSTSLQKEARDKYISKRDEQQEKEAKKHKKKHKRDESLLEMHEKKIKKKKKKEEKEDGKAERRPFSRDTDLQVNRFDEAQKKSIIKKAQALDSRFSRGEAKYL